LNRRITLFRAAGRAAILVSGRVLVLCLFVAVAAGQTTQAGVAATGIYGVGIQMGMAEMGAYAGVDSATLAQGLYYAHGLAQASGCIPTNEIDSIRAAMLATRDSKSLYQRISAYRQSLATYITAHCSCGASCAAGGGNSTVSATPAPPPGPRTPNGYAVDWCLHWGADCGKPAGKSFHSGNNMGLAIHPASWISVIYVSGTVNGSQITGKVHHYNNDDCPSMTMVRR